MILLFSQYSNYREIKKQKTTIKRFESASIISNMYAHKD